MATGKPLNALLSQAQVDDHEEIRLAAEKELKSNSKDTFAQLIHVVSLLKLDLFEKAVNAFEEAGPSLKERAPLEYAYALYKTSALRDADTVAAGNKNGSLGMMHMQAQIAYKREDFEKTRSIYQSLSNQGIAAGTRDNDFRINRKAVEAQSAWSDSASTPSNQQSTREDLEQFETAFNAACRYIARGELRPAELLLSRARELCLAADELSEEDKRAELLPIDAQLVCVQHRQGKHSEAAKTALNVQVKDFGDDSMRRIAVSNQLAAQRDHFNPYLAHQTLSVPSQASLDDELFTFQRSVFSRNLMVLDLQAHKFAHVNKSASSHPWAGVYTAAAHVGNQQSEATVKELLLLFDKRPNDLGLIMTITQIYVLTGKTQTATSHLENFLQRLEHSAIAADHDTRYTPGLIGLIVSLYASQDRTAQAKTELKKAAKHWRRKTNPLKPISASLRAAAAAMLEVPSGDDEELARDIFGLVDENSSRDAVTTAGLLAVSDDIIQSTTSDESPLSSIDELVSDVNAETLEVSGVALLEKCVSSVTSMRQAKPNGTHTHNTAKTRKSRIPKDFDPSKPPDPERWLPMRERSTWRPKGKKKNKSSQGMATQGGFTNDEARSSAQQQTTAQPKGSGSNSTKTKKKKGKGGR